MIKFVDIRESGLVSANFAFFDEDRREFIRVGQEYVFEDWEDFETRALVDSSCPHNIAFYKNLCPDWVHA